MSVRNLNPLPDGIQFDFIYPNSYKPYLIPLKKELRSPFIQEPKPFEAKPETPKKDEKKEEKEPKDEIKPVEIDFEGICDRVIEFPVSSGIYGGLSAIKDRLFYVNVSLENLMEDDSKFDLMCYDLNKLESGLIKDFTGYHICQDGSAILIARRINSGYFY